MNKLLVTGAPHIKSPVTTTGIMRDVIIALVPALAASALIFGLRSLLVVAVCVTSCIAFEWLYEKLMKRTSTINDLSAVITGMLLAYSLPETIPLWQAIFGSFIAIVVVKQLFGGIGKNFANPALTARIAMFLAFSATMSVFTAIGNDAVSSATTAISSATSAGSDAVSSATPLALIAEGQLNKLPSLWHMLLGQHGGTLGETSALALLLGGLYLIVRRVITWHTPVCFVATVFAFTALLGQAPVYQVLSGGLLLSAIFMATDYVTSPQTSWGKVVFGIGAGLLTVVFRVYGNYPEGVSFAILLMNILTPYISRMTMPKPLGDVSA